jgi:acyl-CoA dehydrogenase
MNNNDFLFQIKTLLDIQITSKLDSIENNLNLSLACLKQLGELKAYGVMIPEESGGLGLSAVTLYAMIKQVAFYSVDLALAMSIPVFTTYILSLYASPALQKSILSDLISGCKFCAFAFTEKGDTIMEGLQTKIVKEQDSYIVQGKKVMISWANKADYYLTIANFQIDKKISRPAAILVDAAASGLSFSQPREKIAFDTLILGDIDFNRVKTEKDTFIGQAGQGLKIADEALQLGRLCISTIALALSEKILNDIRFLIIEPRSQNGCLADFQSIQFNYTEIFMQYEAAKVMLEQTWQKWEKKDKDKAKYVLITKILAARTVLSIAEKGWQLAGGAGYLKGHPMEKYFHKARIFGIIEGATDVLLNQVAKQLLRK